MIGASLLRFALAARLFALAGGSLTVDNAAAITADVLDVASEEDAIDAAPIVLVFGLGESAWRPLRAKPPEDSCGELQLGEVARDGHSCTEVLADWKLGIRLWLRARQRLIAICGSVRGALGALASGKCNGAKALVQARLKAAGEFQ